ncbi:MAG TPA: hypothetical protein VMT71_05880 [Syntrophorhabdales bacterium]|nr:hypothetical protein [Syntrophorhabdales bacterium]
MFTDASFPAAYIDGRRYKLQAPAREAGSTCGECHGGVASLFFPMTE